MYIFVFISYKVSDLYGQLYGCLTDFLQRHTGWHFEKYLAWLLFEILGYNKSIYQGK